MGRKAVIKKRNTNLLKRDKYLEKLTAIFKKHGLKKFSMDSIASELKVSKATLYHYFSSKDEMVEMSLTKVLSELATFESITKNNTVPYEKRLYSILELFSVSFTDISTLFLADLQDEYPILWKQLQLFIDYTAEVLTHFYDSGKKAGVFTDIHTSILVMSDRMFFNAISDTEFLRKNRITLQIAFDEYYKLKCFGFIKEEKNRH